jgi:hypothetical protein
MLVKGNGSCFLQAKERKKGGGKNIHKNGNAVIVDMRQYLPH